MTSLADVELPSFRRATVLAKVIAVLISEFLTCFAARAQTAPDAVADNALLQTMLARPSNLEAPLQYAVDAKKAGDIEAAIGALERLLFYSPNLPAVRFELGMLYFRLGSFEMARGYFLTVQ